MARCRSLSPRTRRSPRWAGCGFRIKPSVRDLLFAGHTDGVTLEALCVSSKHKCGCALARHSGPMGHVSVPFRHASGGTVSSLLGVVVLCVLQITHERLF